MSLASRRIRQPLTGDLFSPDYCVPMPAALVYAVLSHATKSSFESNVLSALHQALQHAGTYPAGEELRRLAFSGMPQAIVPFKRRSLDILCAAHIEPRLTMRKFCGEGMEVPAGYFMLGFNRPRYVDEVLPGHREYEQLMHPQKVGVLLTALFAASNQWPELSVPDEDEDQLMVLAGGFLDYIEPPLGNDATPVVMQMRLMAPDGRVARDMGCLELIWQRERARMVLLHGQGARPEVVMELQAAAAAGAWVQMECHLLRYLGPLPDLMLPGDSRKGWLYPSAAVEQHFDGRSHDIPVPIGCARELMQQLPWAYVSEPLYAYTAANSHDSQRGEDQTQ